MASQGYTDRVRLSLDMSGERYWRNGDLPHPPPGVTSAVAWQKAAVAELKATEAADRALDMFEQLGGLRRDVGNWLTPVERRIGAFEASLKALEAGQKEIAAMLRDKLPELEANAREARTSSSDLSEEVAGIEDAIAKLPKIDSQRVRSMIDERYETIVSKEKLAALEKQAAVVEEERRTRAAERRAEDAARKADRRARKTGLYISVVGGIVVAIATGIVTYLETRALPAAPRDTTSQSH